jgi:hypothetical protein
MGSQQAIFFETNATKNQKNLWREARLSEGWPANDWFWEAYWTENGRDVSRRFSENAYGDGVAEQKARECRRATEGRLPNFKRGK